LAEIEGIDHIYATYRTAPPILAVSRTTLLQHDLAYPASWSDLHIDVLIHAAALRPAVRCELDYSTAIRTNILGTAHMVEWARQNGVRQFLFLSVQSVYQGDAPPFTEQSPVDALDLYSVTKLAAEQIVANRLKDNAEYQILRLSHVVGLRDREDGVLEAFCRGVRYGKLVVHGNGTQTACFLHLEDLADAVIRCLSVNPPSGIYNVSTETISVRQLALLFQREARSQLGIKVALCHADGGMIRRFGLETSKIMAATGWRPQWPVGGVVEQLVRHIAGQGGCPT
jgi:nucleoside-diphosphate-sugar epimerase